jgi:hypothetical protein
VNSEIYTDAGTVVRADQAALIFGEDGSMSMVVPNFPADKPVPPLFRLMFAICMKCDDPEWVEEMIEENERVMS